MRGVEVVARVAVPGQNVLFNSSKNLLVERLGCLRRVKRHGIILSPCYARYPARVAQRDRRYINRWAPQKLASFAARSRWRFSLLITWTPSSSSAVAVCAAAAAQRDLGDWPRGDWLSSLLGRSRCVVDTGSLRESGRVLASLRGRALASLLATTQRD